MHAQSLVQCLTNHKHSKHSHMSFFLIFIQVPGCKKGLIISRGPIQSGCQRNSSVIMIKTINKKEKFFELKFRCSLESCQLRKLFGALSITLFKCVLHRQEVWGFDVVAYSTLRLVISLTQSSFNDAKSLINFRSYVLRQRL